LQAFIKAIGSGMSVEPSRIEFVIRDQPLPQPPSAPAVDAQPQSPLIQVLLDGQRRPGWRFDLFWVDAHHVGCLAKGPFADAVDQRSQAAHAHPPDLLSASAHVLVLSVLLVACPCAFDIATPSAVSAGIANMARRQVLIKGGVYFELAGKIDTLLVDKTGTLTFGRPRVEDVVPEAGVTESEVVRLAAIAEKYSEHPLAKAVLAAARERGLEVPDPAAFKIETGFGVTAQSKGESILVGKQDLLRDRGIQVPPRLTAELGAQAQRLIRPVHGLGIQSPGVGDSLAQAHDPAERIHHAEPVACRARDQQAAVVGPQIKRAIDGAVASRRIPVRRPLDPGPFVAPSWRAVGCRHGPNFHLGATGKGTRPAQSNAR
jgi:hypothetical protein